MKNLIKSILAIAIILILTFIFMCYCFLNTYITFIVWLSSQS